MFATRGARRDAGRLREVPSPSSDADVDWGFLDAEFARDDSTILAGAGWIDLSTREPSVVLVGRRQAADLIARDP